MIDSELLLEYLITSLLHYLDNDHPIKKIIDVPTFYTLKLQCNIILKILGDYEGESESECVDKGEGEGECVGEGKGEGEGEKDIDYVSYYLHTSRG